LLPGILKSRVATLFLLYLTGFVKLMDSLVKLLIDELEKITEPQGIDVVELKAYRGKGGLNIEAVIYKENGVTIDDCERITRLFNARLQVFEPLEEENYFLQISSPGLTRELKTPREFEIFKGRKIKAVVEDLERSMKGSRVILGILKGLDGEAVTFEVDGKDIVFPIEKIRKIKLNG